VPPVDARRTAAVKNLAPMILRQRLVVEGTCPEAISDSDIKDFLSTLSDKLKMETVLDPVTHESTRYGWAGWIHWENSGAHFYAWDQPMLFFSVDIYTCKEFDTDVAVDFTREYFKADKIEHKSF